MENNYDELNRFQIIRIDARECFVESKSDSFPIGKAHLEFSQYDMKRPPGQRQTSHVHIYIDIPEFLCLAQEAASGTLFMRAKRQKEAKDQKPLYECLGGTSAERLRQYGRERTDGKSLARVVKLIWGEKADYLFVASSGPGEKDAKGLIVPRFGNAPENHVKVSMSHSSFNELMLMTQIHYQAWLSYSYMKEWNSPKIQGSKHGMYGGIADGKQIGKDYADDMKMF